MSGQPSTPRKKRPTYDEFYRIIRSLNDEFQLCLSVPDRSLSPHRRKLQPRGEEQERIDNIYSRAQHLYFTNFSHLSLCIADFRSQADGLLKEWVHKPQGDPDTTPTNSTIDPLRGRSFLYSSRARADLQQALLDILNAHRPRSWSKRPSDEFPDPNSKRSKCPSGPQSEDVDDIPVRTKAANPSTARPETEDADAGTSKDLYNPYNIARQSQSFSSVNRSAATSRLSFVQSIFSAEDCGSSQATVPFDNSQKHSQDLYPACTQEYEALDESFSKYEAQSDDTEAQHEEPDLPPFFSQIHDLQMHDPQCHNSEGTVYSSIPDMIDLDIESMTKPPIPLVMSLEDRLRNIWPQLPVPHLNNAPLLIIWELTRAAIHCDVDLRRWDLDYDSSWLDQTMFRGQLSTHRLFVGKGLPSACYSPAWTAASNSFQAHTKAVTLCAELTFSTKATGPLFDLKFRPPQLELNHRLGRRFGADRFLEVIIPSITSRDVPGILKNDDHGPEKVIKWLVSKPHYFLGRNWSAFFVANADIKIKDSQNPHKRRQVPRERVYFFATDGLKFRIPSTLGYVPPVEEGAQLDTRTKMSRSGLLEWALSLSVKVNSKQPVPKLFSRLALSLSRTHATVLLETHQIRIQSRDIGTHAVMNDGIGRMSSKFAQNVAESLGLSEVPSAYQGRLGSAKGMWIVDYENDLDDQVWIETFPSQRKWQCDFQDVHHRTFEVRCWSRELKPASLNQQFIPIFESQSYKPRQMRKTIANRLTEDLKTAIASQVNAMNHPMDLRAWIHSAGFSSGDRLYREHVSFLAGLPDRDEDVVPFLLDAGFDANKNLHLQNLIYSLRYRQAELLRAKMNIGICQSTYAYMVVDFTGTLEEGEVQLTFSNRVLIPNGKLDFFLDGIDILVARSPAHFVSDVQRVKAVFRPNLRPHQDVILFSSKGKSPLADLLSGGDYDGDKAWVCWDPDIVQNFKNAPKPCAPDLIRDGYVRKDNSGTFSSVFREAKCDLDEACTNFLQKAFSFNMQQSLLGMCTHYKEKLCYYESRVDSERAVALSTLVGLLVDQPKQGLLFTENDFHRLQKDMKMMSMEPEYEKENSSSYIKKGRPVHILDYLKFEVARTTIEEALATLTEANKASGAVEWDKDLATLYEDYKSQKEGSRTITKLMDTLMKDVQDLEQEWKKAMASGKQDARGSDYTTKVDGIYQKWLDIQPHKSLLNSKTVNNLLDEWNGDPRLSKWAMLKASTTFKLCYKRTPKFAWRIAGYQLAWMKAKSSRRHSAADASAMPVTAEMWNVLRPASKQIARLAAMRASGQDSESLIAIEEVTEYDDYGTQIDDT